MALCAPRPCHGNDTSLPACEEYVEENPRLQVAPNEKLKSITYNIWKFWEECHEQQPIPRY